VKIKLQTPNNKEISILSLGFIPASDRFYLAFGQSVRGYTKKVITIPSATWLKLYKGVQFFKYEANTNEVLKHFFTDGQNMLIGGEFSVSHMVNGKEKHFFILNGGKEF
jgi:hypothetical protein